MTRTPTLLADVAELHNVVAAENAIRPAQGRVVRHSDRPWLVRPGTLPDQRR